MTIDPLANANPDLLQNKLLELERRLAALEQGTISFNSASEAMLDFGDLAYPAFDDEGNLRMIMSAVNLLAEFGINAHFAGFNQYGKPQFYFSADDGGGELADGLMKLNIDGITFSVDGVFIQGGTEPESSYAVRIVDDGDNGERIVDDGGLRVVFASDVKWNWTFLGTLYANFYIDSGTTKYYFGNHGFTLSADFLLGRGSFEDGTIGGFTETGTPEINPDAPSGQYSLSVDKDNYISFNIPCEYGQYFLIMVKVKSDTQLRFNVTNGGAPTLDLPTIPGKWIKYPVLIRASSTVATTITVAVKSTTSGVPALIDDLKVFRVNGFSTSSAIRDLQDYDFSQYTNIAYSDHQYLPSRYDIRADDMSILLGRTPATDDPGKLRTNSFKVDRILRSYRPNIKVSTTSEIEIATSGTISPTIFSPTYKKTTDAMIQLTSVSRGVLTAAAARNATYRIYAHASAPLFVLLAQLPAFATPAVIGNYIFEMQAKIGMDFTDRKYMICFAQMVNEANPKFYRADVTSLPQINWFRVTVQLNSVASFYLQSDYFESKFLLEQYT